MSCTEDQNLSSDLAAMLGAQFRSVPFTREQNKVTHEALPLATRDQLWVAETNPLSTGLKLIGSSCCRMGTLKADWVLPLNVMRSWKDAVTTDSVKRDLRYKLWEVKLLEDDEQVHTTLYIRSAS